MLKTSRRGFAMTWILILSGSGCAIYEERPLDPDAELQLLGKRRLEDFQVKYLKPGEQARSEGEPFTLSDGLDEDELVAVALTLNPDLAARRFERGEARALLITAGLWPNPEVGFSYRPGIAGAPGYSIDTDLLLELLKPWERAARKEVAHHGIEEAEAAIVAEEWQVAREARKGRLQVLFGREKLALLDQEVPLRERILDLLKRRKEIGDATELDISAAALELSAVRRDRREARAELEAVEMRLNRLLGLPPRYRLPLKPLREPGGTLSVTVVNDPSDEELEKWILQGRFELRAKEAAYKKAEAELRLAIYRQYPNLKVGPSYERESEGGDFLGIGASIELPLFDRNQGIIAEKEYSREKARAEYRALLHGLRADAYGARQKLRRAREEVDAQEKEILPLLRKSRDLVERAFQAGELNVLDWVAMETRALAARKQHLQSIFEYQEALIHLETATGSRLSNPSDQKEQKETENGRSS